MEKRPAGRVALFTGGAGGIGAATAGRRGSDGRRIISMRYGHADERSRLIRPAKSGGGPKKVPKEAVSTRLDPLRKAAGLG
jgi:NAD(P)-dependent dehydrogenase (short-subunit alcohol dehydrogenase family)